MLTTWRRRLIAVTIVGAVSGFAGYAYSLSQSSSARQVASPPTPSEVAQRRVAAINADVPDQVPIVDSKGEAVGSVARADYDKLISTPGHDAHDVMVEVRDAQGQLTGYVALGTGFIDLATAQAPGFSLSDYRAAHGGR